MISSLLFWFWRSPQNVPHRDCIFFVRFTTPVLGANYIEKPKKNASISNMELLFSHIIFIICKAAELVPTRKGSFWKFVPQYKKTLKAWVWCFYTFISALLKIDLQQNWAEKFHASKRPSSLIRRSKIILHLFHSRKLDSRRSLRWLCGYTDHLLHSQGHHAMRWFCLAVLNSAPTY